MGVARAMPASIHFLDYEADIISSKDEPCHLERRLWKDKR